MASAIVNADVRRAARARLARAVVSGLVGAIGLVSSGACKGPTPAAAPRDATPPDAGAAAPPPSSNATADEPGGDTVRPVYPLDSKPPLPLAEEYCNAVKETVRKRRGECCPRVGAMALTGECTRTLSSALRSGAVTLEKADVDACAAAFVAYTTGCDWVTSTGEPTVPACLGIIKGTLKDGAVCRSSLECEEGLRCQGLGATRPGRCAPPLARGYCNIATDSLATFTSQTDVDRRHPECTGVCSRRQCREIAAGAVCTATFECGPKAYCVAGKCARGAPPGVGQPCTDACVSSARCLKGHCVAVKAAGESCEDDAECRSRCSSGDGGNPRQCAGDCPIMLPARLPAKQR